jgi:hypothetical protein
VKKMKKKAELKEPKGNDNQEDMRSKQGDDPKEEAAVHPADIPGDITVCQKAPELAEHYRYDDEHQPCDDGRAG